MYIILTKNGIGRVLMVHSIYVEAEFAEERTEDHGTTFLSLDGRTEVGFLTTYCDVYV